MAGHTDGDDIRLLRGLRRGLTGGAFVVHEKPTELFPGVWLTGPVSRANDEKNWTPGLSLDTPQGRRGS
ncbi:MAG TPA: hypothetical protein VK580_13680 [Steroidobacteraceae bacterium]|jgi:hypothetical protein|nr:hypothetical protein [Steroidobacteraceae bacterium]